MTINIDVKIIDQNLIHENITPQYAHFGDAGIDLRACSISEPIEIPPHAQWTINTGVAVQPTNSDMYVAFLVPRSSMGRKGLRLVNTIGIIDSTYQGEIKAIVTNDSNETLTISPYERVVQLIVMPFTPTRINLVADFSALTDRGAGGFGSSGKM